MKHSSFYFPLILHRPTLRLPPVVVVIVVVVVVVVVVLLCGVSVA